MRKRGLTAIKQSRTRFLCPDCEELKLVEQFSQNHNYCALECGHVRILPLLPSALGAISLEHIIADTPEAKRLFPALDTPPKKKSDEEGPLEQAIWEQSVHVNVEDVFAERERHDEAFEERGVEHRISEAILERWAA